MNCSLTDIDRGFGKRCRSFDCSACLDYSNKEVAEQSYGFAMVLGIFINSPEIKMARKGWNGKGLFIQLQEPTETSKMDQPYIYITTVQGRVPWAPSQTDILAMDWVIV